MVGQCMYNEFIDKITFLDKLELSDDLEDLGPSSSSNRSVKKTWQ